MESMDGWLLCMERIDRNARWGLAQDSSRAV